MGTLQMDVETHEQDREETRRRDGEKGRRACDRRRSETGEADAAHLAHGCDERREVLISPTGERYHGTAAEVRAARLYPWERAYLAQALKVWHYCWLTRRYCAESREELRRIAADRRRYIIQSHEAKAGTEDTRGFDRKILAAACARHMGMTAEQFRCAWIDVGISATIDEAPDGGEFLTRYEREAMDTPLYEWCGSLYAKQVLSERRAEGKERKA